MQLLWRHLWSLHPTQLGSTPPRSPAELRKPLTDLERPLPDLQRSPSINARSPTKAGSQPPAVAASEVAAALRDASLLLINKAKRANRFYRAGNYSVATEAFLEVSHASPIPQPNLP